MATVHSCKDEQIPCQYSIPVEKVDSVEKLIPYTTKFDRTY